jgi:hypothetical protein
LPCGRSGRAEIGMLSADHASRALQKRDATHFLERVRSRTGSSTSVVQSCRLADACEVIARALRRLAGRSPRSDERVGVEHRRIPEDSASRSEMDRPCMQDPVRPLAILSAHRFANALLRAPRTSGSARTSRMAPASAR